jgi:hypothetical protein
MDAVTAAMAKESGSKTYLAKLYGLFDLIKRMRKDWPKG